MPHTSPPSNSNRLRRIAVAIVAGAALAIIGGLVVVALLRRNQLPLVTFDNLNAAAERWAAHGPRNYDLTLQLSGVQSGAVSVQVRGGQVAAMTLNERPTKSHLWDDWSVAGLLAIIRRDLEACAAANPQADGANAKSADSAAQVDPVIPRGTFDEQFGYPLEYRRLLPGGNEAVWRIVKFAPVP